MIESRIRITDPVKVDGRMIEAIIASGQRPTIQFSQPGYSPELLRSVNHLCGKFGKELEVRFFGHYGGHFDASVLNHIPDVSWLSVDCLEIVNEQEIANLAPLRRLSFGVYKFDKPRFLYQLDLRKLDSLVLSENAKRNLDLSALQNSRELETLFLNGFSKNIEVLAGLPKLKQLSLGGIAKTQSLRFVCDMSGLRSLTLILGSRQSIDEIAHPGLEELSVLRVRGLEGLGSLERFPCLRELTVEDQNKIGSINVSGSSLRKLILMNCKNLKEIEGLGGLGELVEFRTSQTRLDLKALLEGEWPPSLEVLALYSGSQKWNDAARETLNRRGYREFASNGRGCREPASR
jgi:hypothetical protein